MPRLSPRARIIVKKIVIAAAVLYVLFNPYSYRLVKLSLEERRIKNEIARLNRENSALSAEIKRLESDPEYYGYVVRRELGMIKPGEVEYRFVPSGYFKKKNKE